MSDKPKRLTIICLPPQDKPVYFAVPLDWDDYSVEEGRCPSDLFIAGCEAVIIDGDSDPHGLFEFVRTVETPEFLSRGHSPDDEWPKIIPEAYPNTIDGEVSWTKSVPPPQS